MIPLKVSLPDAIQKLKDEHEFPFTVVMKNGTMSVEYFAPADMDTQTPHKQDELYIIAGGSSEFIRNGERVDCNTGDVLFVPAGTEHRFENFTSDFATWVIFYGPDGGESKD